MDEEQLAGGVANAGKVTRVGAHVFRPSNPHSSSVHAFLRALRSTGFTGASEPVGIDADGRERLVFLEGDVPLPPYPAWAQTDEALASVAALMRSFHSASAAAGRGSAAWSTDMADPVGGPIICHNDVCLENVVFRDGIAVGLLDFDYASPGRPVYDLAQMARMCVPVDGDPDAARLGWQSAGRPARLRLVADTYGLDRTGRAELSAVLSDSIARGGEFVRRKVEAGDPGFVEMWNAMGGMERFHRRRAWWSRNRAAFASALA